MSQARREKEDSKTRCASPDSSSSSSSSSDSENDAGACPNKKNKTMKSWLGCLNFRKRKAKSGCPPNDKKPCETISRCSIFLGFLLLSLLVFLYFYGAYLLSLLGHLLFITIPSLFKSTNTIVDEALAKYSADRLGRADYALESAGGSILCSSETYHSRSGALYSIFGVPLWYHSSSPREIIQPDVQPGKCWAMDGDSGYVMVQLTMPIVVSAVSLEHIPAQVAPAGRLDSAPKDFLIVGKENNMDSPDIVLGSFVYMADLGKPIQTFQIKDPYCTRQSTNYDSCGPNQQVFRVIELRVLSNHGNKEYTCLYRLRVHGTPLSAIHGQNLGHEIMP